ncbi:zinc finger protein [Culex quinquefasciatus]|uniref:Zinc finger protein n=1 Tax=Culex quinquefasciatus TaxID=7176 RepID=B0X5L0_CULQU|nr:zinc finger protein [Culex quinquefasciatus]|eukprot:XP_001864932.1 zinc finger protein [Culex quinquefasciatus]
MATNTISLQRRRRLCWCQWQQTRRRLCWCQWQRNQQLPWIGRSLIRCTECPKSFALLKKRRAHKQGEQTKPLLTCPNCDQHFRQYSNLAQHRNRHHLNKISPNKDIVCHYGEVFQSKAKMEWYKENLDNLIN